LAITPEKGEFTWGNTALSKYRTEKLCIQKTRYFIGKIEKLRQANLKRVNYQTDQCYRCRVKFRCGDQVIRRPGATGKVKLYHKKCWCSLFIISANSSKS
jgi:hypothetical protein